MRIAAVIPNWNGAELLRSLIPTMKAQTRAFDSVFVVDNGSSDDSVEVANEFGATVVPLDRNYGFAPAVNRGASRADADILAILNTDVELDPRWLEIGVAALADERVAFVAGKTVSSHNASLIDGTFDALCRGGCALRCGAGTPDGPYWSTRRIIQFAPMTAMLVRTSVFSQLGGLDEAFESYMEDVEFGLRCASNGYTGVYEPAMLARHRGSATLGAWSSRSVRNISRNQVILLARHYSWPLLWRFGWAIATAQVLWGLSAIRHGEVAAWIAGKIEGLRLFRSLRRTGSVQLPIVLFASERVIAEVQRQVRSDWYWRLYFALTTKVPDE